MEGQCDIASRLCFSPLQLLSKLNRRTGLKITRPIVKDIDGSENIDDFFHANGVALVPFLTLSSDQSSEPRLAKLVIF